MKRLLPFALLTLLLTQACDDIPKPVTRESLKAARDAKNKAVEDDNPYGAFTPQIRKLEEQLEKERCDREKILKLGEAYYRAGAFRPAVERSDKFLKECGAYPRLRWVTYESYKALSEWDKAIDEATALIDSDRYDVDYRVWRGLCYEQKGEWDKAAADYQQALNLNPRLMDVPLNLSNVLEKDKKFCEASRPLEQLMFYYPETENDPKITLRLADLHTRGDCAQLTDSAGSLKLSADKTGTYRAKVNVNKTKTKRFVVDTGASAVVISRDHALEAGLNLDNAPVIFAQTVSGPVAGRAVLVEEITVGKLVARRVPTLVLDKMPEGVDGLLGMTYLSRFHLEQADGKLTIKPR